MTAVKICGVTNVSDAQLCAGLGADFIGNIVGIPSSPRNITVEESKAIIGVLPENIGGVVVMAPKCIEEVEMAVEVIRPCGVQLHGKEDIDFVEDVKRAVSCKVIKAIHVGGEASVLEALEFSKVCDAILLDTPTEKLGGSGETHDWTASSQIVESAKCDVFLAGGLRPENVKEAVEEVGPYCVDTSSGVEAQPGKKDPEKVRRFIEEAKRIT